ncbi:uncharacterized protein LOC117647968 [Thrips palmi]|uniref:Uncharacterized protein LOC117647968 n=1 Tax=Thrips palmi TaxID=161013 RepID=A0A6P8Z0C2_THRPL|nr:uncharacterized protein LOC117647968 [Thrips palmi]XP_034245897.1 uncharacterized protein LOC117647968 [Thrips palmi]
MRPASHKETKNFSWGASGALSVDVQLPLGGYVPGQTIFGQIQVDNGSNVRVERVVCTLHEEVKWTANRGSTTTVTEVTSSVFEGAVQAHSSKTISLAMPVPTVAPSKEALFSLIELKYFLRVTAEVSGYRGNLHYDLPVMVGTIPVFGPDDHKAEKSDRASPPRKTDLPPPTYEEADLKGKNKFVRRFKLGQAPYKPRYPVWDFSNVLRGK